MENDAIERRLLTEMDELTLMLEGFEKTSGEYAVIAERLYDVSTALESYATYHKIKVWEKSEKAACELGKNFVEKVIEAVNNNKDVYAYYNSSTNEIEFSIEHKNEDYEEGDKEE